MAYELTNYEWEPEEFHDGDLANVTLIFDVEFDYEDGEPMVRYYPDGSGYPGCPASVYFERCHLIRVVSERHDRLPLRAESEYWQNQFEARMSDDDSLREAMFEEVESCHDSMEAERYEYNPDDHWD